MKEYTVNEARDIVSRYFAKKGVTLDDAKETGCGGLNCSACVFYTQKRCGFNFLEKECLARAEAELNKVDWSKVKVDTKILVRENEQADWVKRYFAKYENECVFAWFGGVTSWSACGKEVLDWKYAKLAEEEEND